MKFKAGDLIVDYKGNQRLVMGFDEHGNYLINYLSGKEPYFQCKMVEHTAKYIETVYNKGPK
jgi:hypothetical protein